MLDLNYTLLVQLCLFLVVMVSLNILVFRPLGRLHERRRSFISGLEEKAAALEREKEERLAAYEKHLEELKRDVLGYKNGIKAQIDRERAMIIEQARDEAESILSAEEEKLKAEIVIARRALGEQTRDLANLVFATIVGRSPGRVKKG